MDELYILNDKFEKLGIIEDASIIWNTRYYDVGDFEIYTGASTANLDLLKKNNLVQRIDDEKIGIIENIRISSNEEGAEYITAVGRFAESILDRRIVWKQTQLYGTVENGLRNLVNDNFINPTVTDRKIDIIELGELKGYTERLEAQYTGDNILQIHKDVSLANQIGFKFVFTDFKFKHELYKGIDRSYNQTENTFVVFSDEYDNLLSTDYELNTSNIKNVALVAGEGEGTARKTFVVGSEKGLNRREVFVDARDISTNNGEITTEDYNKALKEKGIENIVTITQAFSGEVDLEQNYIYKKDFNIGDIVTIENKKWGVYINSRIIEIMEVKDENGYKITPVFGI